MICGATLTAQRRPPPGPTVSACHRTRSAGHVPAEWADIESERTRGQSLLRTVRDMRQRPRKTGVGERLLLRILRAATTARGHEQPGRDAKPRHWRWPPVCRIMHA